MVQYRDMQSGSHYAKKLNEALHLFGIHDFAFRVLEYCKPDKLLELVRRWKDRLTSRLLNNDTDL